MQTDALPAVPSTALFAVAAEWRRDAEMHRNSCRLQEEAGKRDKADRHYQRSLDLDTCAKRIENLANETSPSVGANEKPKTP
jgi:hypothetical protein